MIQVGSEFSGELYLLTNSFKKLIKPLIPHLNQKNNDDCNFIIRAPLSGSDWNIMKKPYIYWSGESRLPSKSKFHTDHIFIITFIYEHPKSLYIPFCLESEHIYKNRIDTNLNREYLIAYCSSNKVDIREKLFNLFVEKVGESKCRSYGVCYGKYPNTNYRFDGVQNYQGFGLISIYRKHKFVFALENNNVYGCVTEKIVNAFYSGAIPIYWGSKNINDLFNKNAFINVDDFNTLEDCVEYVINLSDEKRDYMLKQPIYTNSEVINLLNDDYNSRNNNKTLVKYKEIIKNFIDNI